MVSTFSSLIERGKAFIGYSSSADDERGDAGFRKAPNEISLFPKTDPIVDGEDCDHDCATCVVQYPKKWSIDEDDRLYGKINGWATVGAFISLNISSQSKSV